MGVKKYLKLVGIIIFFAAVAGGGYYYLAVSRSSLSTTQPTLRDQLFGWKYPIGFPSTGPGGLAYSDIRDPGGIPQGLPVRLKVPAIGVDSAIEDALITPDGRMDVPQGSVNVAWFALGPHPGQEGSAVIGGHFGIRDGIPFVFYNLDKLQVGDKIYVEDDRGVTLAFGIRAIRSFERNDDATPVFTSNDGLAHLNLITCEGIWNQVNDTYPQRLVIFTDLIPAEGEAVADAEVLTTTKRSLTLGARGADVAALQSVLVELGFLSLQAGYTKGYYGPLTRDAVLKYQVSVGLPSTGIIDPTTRATLESGDVVATQLPVASERVVVPPIATTSSPGSRQVVHGLFETPADSIVTSILLISILYVTYRIFRRTRGTIKA